MRITQTLHLSMRTIEGTEVVLTEILYLNGKADKEYTILGGCNAEGKFFAYHTWLSVNLPLDDGFVQAYPNSLQENFGYYLGLWSMEKLTREVPTTLQKLDLVDVGFRYGNGYFNAFDKQSAPLPSMRDIGNINFKNPAEIWDFVPETYLDDIDVTEFGFTSWE